MPCGMCGDIIPTEVVRCPACGAWSHKRDFRALALGLFVLLGFNGFLALGAAISMMRLRADLSAENSFSYAAGLTGQVLRTYGEAFVISASMAAITAILFVAWLWQAHRQAPGPLRHRGLWTVAGWLVPVVNLWLPPRIVQDVWISSGRYRMAERHGVMLVVTVWWTSLLGAAGLAWLYSGLGAESLPDARFAADIGVAASGGLALAAALCMGVVYQVTRLQLRS